MNSPHAQMNLVTYSSFCALPLNFQLPVLHNRILAAKSISIKQYVSGFTALNLLLEFTVSLFLLYHVPCIISVCCFYYHCHIPYQDVKPMPGYVAAIHVHFSSLSVCTAKKKKSLQQVRKSDCSGQLSEIILLFLIKLVVHEIITVQKTVDIYPW